MPDTDSRPASMLRSRSTNSIHPDDHNHHHQSNHHAAHRHRPKQFHVATRGHGRIPSYGRNLNKLGGAGGKPATSPKARHHGSDSDTAGQRAKRATFELGSPESSFTEAPAAPVARLRKSSSSHSLEKGSRRRGPSKDRKKNKSSDALSEMTLPVAALPPPTPPSHHHHPPVTPAHSLPSEQDQPLTSRFEHTSPSSANDSQILSRRTPASDVPPPSIPRSDSTYSITSTSRTQQKLWLQRASSQADLPPAPSGAVPADRFEKITREYMNVRRFKNPLADGMERVRQMRGRMVIPKRAGEGDGQMGLSRSLNDTEGRRRRAGTRAGMGEGSRDDMGVPTSGVSGQRQMGEVEALLKRLWAKEEMLPSNE